MTCLSFLDQLADSAEQSILPFFRKKIDIENKYQIGFDPVTEADKAGEKAMRLLIEKTYPEHGIFGEEYGTKNANANNVWILDPIDGTRSFISGIPVWGTLIGFKQAEQAILGMMCQPFMQERFSGNGKKAWYQKGKTSTKQEINTRPCKSLNKASLFTTSPDLFEDDKKPLYQRVEAKAQLVRYGIDCYAYCMLAMGQLDCVIESGLGAYDIAALIPIIKGAGGEITTWDGKNAVHGGSIVATGDKALHEIILNELNS